MTGPSFSICIPNYNYAHYIGETIQSVLDQTYQNFEIVVVDNASTDKSVEVIKKFAEADPRIKLYQNQYNVGFAPNLDRAAQKASNDYIIMLSSDDIMRPKALEEYVDILTKLGEESNRALLTSAYEVIDEKGKAKEYRDRKFHFHAPFLDKMNLGLENYVETFSGLAVFKDVFPRMSVPGPFCSQMYSRKLYELVGGYSSINLIGPDAHLAYKFMLHDTIIIFVNKPLFGYRVHQTNQISQVKANKSVNVLIDRYLFTKTYSDQQLEKAGVERKEIIQYLIDHECLKGGLIELANGSWYDGLRYFMFGLATYPETAIRQWKFYPFVFLLLLGPIGVVLARWLHKGFFVKSTTRT